MSKTTDEIRKGENERVLRMMRDGESLSRIPAEMTFFPPRPIIKKDPKEIARLFQPKLIDFVPQPSDADSERIGGMGPISAKHR